MRYLQGSVEFEEKAFGDTGSFEGYAAVFGNVDQGGDILERGAFKEIAKNAEGRVVVCNQHNVRDPIGTEVAEDSKGLHFRGALVMEVPSARNAYALMRAKALTGMSFGYDILPGGAKITEAGVRQLKSVKLWEISPVTFGMNPLAGITDVKEALRAGRAALPDIEEALRDAFGLTRSEAKTVMGHGFARLLAQRDAAAAGAGSLTRSVEEALSILKS